MAGRTLDELLARHERMVLEEILARHGGHKGKAAKALGISRIRLWRRLKAHGMLTSKDATRNNQKDSS